MQKRLVLRLKNIMAKPGDLTLTSMFSGNESGSNKSAGELENTIGISKVVS